jgi:prepilin-type processing-associated H-X9-DG protein
MNMPRGYMTVREPLSVGVSASQHDGVTWLKRAALRANHGGGSEIAQALELYDQLLNAGHIRSRSSCLSDYIQEDWSSMTLFRESTARRVPWFSPPLQDRMAIFREAAQRLAREAFRDDSDPPHGVFQVSCTGYDSPHALQRTICDKGWSQATKFWHIGHMGCYAALPAVSLASSVICDEARFAGAPRRGSLLFVELCSLHCRPDVLRLDQVVINYLFADGSVRVDVSSKPDDSAFAILRTEEAILAGTTEDMTWSPSESAFDMTLARSVPARIGREVGAFVDRVLHEAGVERSMVTHFAIHPGGPRIVEMVAARLGLSEHAVRHSLQVLRQRGNMSSATLPHIWRLMQEDPEVRAGDLILSLAFGPGLTVTANLLRRIG